MKSVKSDTQKNIRPPVEYCSIFLMSSRILTRGDFGHFVLESIRLGHGKAQRKFHVWMTKNLLLLEKRSVESTRLFNRLLRLDRLD